MSDARWGDPREFARVIPTPNGRACTTRAKGMNTILGMA
jgi:hypothetical protein